MNNSLVKDSVIYTVGSFLTKAFGFFLIPIYTRYLSVKEYGILALLTVIFQLASFVFLLGVSSASMRYYFNPGADENYRKQVYGNALILLLIFPTILFILLSPIGYILINRYLPSVPFFPFVFVILIVGLLNPIQKLVLGLLRVQKKAKKYITFTFSFFLFQTLTIIVAVMFLKHGLKGVIYAQLVANLFFWVIAVVILRKNSTFSFSLNLTKKLFVFGIPLIPFFIFMWANKASGRFLLEKFGSLEELGIFALAAQFSGLLFFLSNALDNAILPYFYETAQRKNAVDSLGRFSTKYFVFFGLLSLFTLIIAQPLVIFMADPKFHRAVIYIPLLILAGWLKIISKIFDWSLMHSKKTAVISTLTGISAVMMIGLLLLSLKNWNMGIQGVVYAMVLVGLFRIISGYYFSQKHFKIEFRLAELGLISLVMGLSALLINFAPFNDLIFLNILIKIIVFLVTSIFLIKIAKIEINKKLASIKVW
jgi:O-antigen/teichoic acid export membrane protein